MSIIEQDRKSIADTKDILAQEIKNYVVRLDDIYNAQLHNPDVITGSNFEEYLVATARPEAAKQAMDII